MRDTATATAFSELEEAFFRAGDNLEIRDDDDPTWWLRIQDMPTESLVAEDEEDWEWQIALARVRHPTNSGL
jgi:hypothetical protein